MTFKLPESFGQRPFARKHFRNIAQWALTHHPFYQRRGLTQDGEIPLLSRDDILDNNTLLLNNHPITATTSGSTGVPVKISWSEQRKNIERKASERFISWLGGRRSVIRFIHDDTPADNLLDVNSSIADQLMMIEHRRHISDAITTYPSNAERLCRAVIEQRLDMSHIQRFGVYAEVFEAEQEVLIRQAFPNAQIWSTYSSQEFGMIAGRCPHNPRYHHIMAGKIGVEILDDSGQPCPPGQIGRLVITDFFNQNSPLIRYDIGDLAAWGECDCGQIDLPSIEQVLGKIRGSLVHKNGERIPFTHLSVALRDIESMRQYQVIQEQLERFTLRLVNPRGSEDDTLREEVHQVFYQHFGYQTDITIVFEKSIEREQNGKFYSSICRL
ncbi:Phenylacetate-coenzyme A ligase [Sinobacterium norvegicum]|uniref:Phenylacetate-coenzyme A ligase n=1 Tax=Sinobacterium norvegicum TaxID=1641715 RepID=A0ABM9ADN2_9GAMM|nr:hypothetical protein [Sinobacterium norvegicum]CAH0991321.1 Phenylacetate-coenzyme A ligase [Sinobacterium norvegicum]